MTKRWKLKMNSSNILLVLITLMLLQAEWVKGENEVFQGETNSVERNSEQRENGQTHIYIGNEEIAEYFFHSSINNDSFILEETSKCLDSFQLIICLKMFLLSKINDVLSLMEGKNAVQEDVTLLNGLLLLKIKNETINSVAEESEYLSLDEEISAKMKKIFRKRSLLVNLLPNIKIEIQPAPEKNSGGLICFNYFIHEDSELKVNPVSSQNGKIQGRKRKGGGMSMMMLVPPLIMLGLMPFTLASLKAMVMNAVMINMMALNGAIFMTIRNLVFGPRQGDNVKYVNYGYSKDRQTQSPKPVLIIHSPAAFVKQPPVHKKRVHGHSSTQYSTQNHFPESYNLNDGYSQLYHYQNAENIEDYDNIIKQNENQQVRRRQEIQERNHSEYFSGFYKSNDTGQAKRIQNENKNIKQVTTSYENIYKPEIKIHEKNQKQNTHNQSPSTQFISNFIYSDEHEKRKPHLTFRTFRQGGGPGFRPSSQRRAGVAEKLKISMSRIKN